MNAKLQQLVRAMLDQTRADKLKWQSVDEMSFRAFVGSGLVRMTKGGRQGENEYGELANYPYFRFVVSDSEGNVVFDEEIADGETFYETSKSLFGEARRTAFNADKVVDSMLSSMGVSGS